MPIADIFSPVTTELDSPYSNAESITPNDGADLSTRPRALWVGVLGNVAMVIGGATVTITGVQGLIPVRPERILLTGTTATNIISLF